MRSEQVNLLEGRSIAYDMIGDCEPILLIPGRSGVASVWRDFAAPVLFFIRPAI